MGSDNQILRGLECKLRELEMELDQVDEEGRYDPRKPQQASLAKPHEYSASFVGGQNWQVGEQRHVWVPEDAKPELKTYEDVSRWLRARDQTVRAALPLVDIAYSYHLIGIYWYAGQILDAVVQLALAVSSDEFKIDDALFHIQYFAGAIRKRSIQPFTFLYSAMLLNRTWQPNGGQKPSHRGPLLHGSLELRQRIEERLFGSGVKRSAGPKAGALVALAASCVQVRREIAAMAESMGPPLPELRRVLGATERVGWWIDETYPWLKTLVKRLLWEEQEEEEEKAKEDQHSN